jgi:NitT/TauT family transport system substrate-binding protein
MSTQNALYGSLVASLVALGASSPALAQSPKIWRHGIVEAKSDAGFVMMAAQKGFAEKRDLKIEIVQFKGDALALKALIAGELESYEGSPGGPLIAASRGADLKIVGCYWLGLTYGIFVGKDVQKPEDLKGKTFAISSPGALPDLFARTVLDKYNIAATEVRFAALGSDSDRFRAVSAGVVQAAASSTEFAPVVEKQGIRMLLHAHDVAPNYVRFCTYMGSKTIKDKNADAVNFLAAEIEGLTYALANRDEEVKLAKEVTQAKADDVRAEYVFDEVIKYSAIDPTMPIPADKINWMRELLVKTGNLTAPVDVEKMIDGSVREKALALTSQPAR